MRNRSFMMNYHLMLVPGIVLLIIFSIVPMFGVAIAFQDYIPTKGILGSKWIGWENFSYMFSLPDSKQIFLNTITIALMKIAAGLIVPFVFALLLNEARIVLFKQNCPDHRLLAPLYVRTDYEEYPRKHQLRH